VIRRILSAYPESGCDTSSAAVSCAAVKRALARSGTLGLDEGNTLRVRLRSTHGSTAPFGGWKIPRPIDVRWVMPFPKNPTDNHLLPPQIAIGNNPAIGCRDGSPKYPVRNHQVS
jgi:hypothetical protein